MIVKMYGLAMEGNPYWDQAKALFEYGFATPEDVEVGRLVDPGGLPIRRGIPRRRPTPTL